MWKYNSVALERRQQPGTLVIWKRSPQGQGQVKACSASAHSMSSISTSSYDILQRETSALNLSSLSTRLLTVSVEDQNPQKLSFDVPCAARTTLTKPQSSSFLKSFFFFRTFFFFPELFRSRVPNLFPPNAIFFCNILLLFFFSFQKHKTREGCVKMYKLN